MSNPIIGVISHWLGGLASASFYIPYRGVKSWSWETYWLVGGLFSWIIAPMVLASLLVPDLRALMAAAPASLLFWGCLFGAMCVIVLHEWRGTSRRTHLFIAAGLAILIGSSVIVGYGNFLSSPPSR